MIYFVTALLYCFFMHFNVGAIRNLNYFQTFFLN